MSEPQFRPDLYRGTAEDYDRFRLSYPATLTDDLVRRIGAGGGGRLLDLACGTGQVAFALRAHFRDVIGVDQEAGAVSFARAKARRAGASEMQWIAGSAEALAVRSGVFDLVAIGNAFHRLPRRRVAEHCFRGLTPGGHIALLWSDGPWVGAEPWQRAVAALVGRWTERMGATARVPRDLDRALAEQPQQRVLADAGFDVIGKFDFVVPHAWTPEHIAGYASSTSVLPRAVLGAHAARFESELRDTVLAVEPGGTCRQDVSFAYDLARRPVAG